MNTKRLDYNYKDSGLTYFIAMLAPQVVAIVALVILSFFGKTIEGLGGTLFSALIGQACYLVLFFVYGKKAKISYLSAAKLNVKFKWWWALVAIGVSVVAILGFNNFVGLFDKLLSLIGYNPNKEYPLPLTNGWWLLLSLFVSALVPAICEELIFRGVILNGLKPMGEHKAVVLTAALFSLFHMAASQTIYQFILGIILGYIVILGGSLILPMIVHFLNNAIIISINYYYAVNNIVVESPTYTFGYIALWIGVALLVACIFALLIWTCYKKKKVVAQKEKSIDELMQLVGDNKSSEKMTAFNKYMLAGIAFGVILWVVDFIYYIGG